jgi:hypothetical protein
MLPLSEAGSHSVATPLPLVTPVATVLPPLTALTVTLVSAASLPFCRPSFGVPPLPMPVSANTSAESAEPLNRPKFCCT